MIQEIITYIILIISFGVVIFKIVRFFLSNNKSNRNDTCSQCDANTCKGCPFANKIYQNNSDDF